MATTVFSPCTGVVAYTPKTCGNDSKFLSVTVDNKDLITDAFVTGVSIALSGNYQFLHTVNNFIYLYAFGDRISSINITGMGFIRVCNGATNEKTKLQKMYDFYKTNRVAKKTKPLDIVLAGTNSATASFKFIGYLTGMNIDVKTVETSGTVGFWNMRFEAVIDE
jgi:hypothetical protein